MQMAKYMVRWFLLESLLLLCVVFVLWFIWAIIKFSFSLFVHDSSFTMVKCRKCSTLSIRRTEETSRVHVFCFPKCGLNHCCARSVIRMSLKKNIWFRVDQPPGSRGGICPYRQSRRKCKVFASGVNFSRKKQRNLQYKWKYKVHFTLISSLKLLTYY